MTAQRLRHAPIHLPGTHRPFSPAITATSWRRSALAAAIISHTSHLLLDALAHRARQLTPDSSLHIALSQAASTAGHTWPAWRTVAQALDLIRTGDNRETSSPLTADLADLTVRLGRLAYDHPCWTPSVSAAASPRTPENLAPGPDAIAQAVAAVHHAADAVLQVVPPDKDALIDAAARRRLFVRTRLLPAHDDIPYRYGRIPPAQLDDLLTAYTTATRTTQNLVTALDTLATTLGTTTTHLAATRLRDPAAAITEPEEHHASRRRDQWALQALLPESGRVEQALRALHVSDPAMLTQAATIDSATQNLIDQATAKTRRRNVAKDAQPALSPAYPNHRRRPPQVAGLDSPDSRSPRQAPAPVPEA